MNVTLRFASVIRPRRQTSQTRRLAALTAGLFLAALSVNAVPAAAAPPGFAFLEIPAGARASALGGAYSSLARGADAAFWNPAGLGGTTRFQVSGNHAELDQQLRYDAVALAGRLWGGGYGMSMRALYSEAIEARDELGNLTGSFGAHDLEFALSYGHAVGSGLALGGSAQIVRERIADVAAQTYGFNFGATLDPGVLPGMRLSLGVHNVGPAARYTFDDIPGEDVGLPMRLHSGASVTRLVGSGLTLRGAVEGSFTSGRPGRGAIGAEVANLGGAALRAGWRFNDASADLTLGAGFATKALSFDYAFIPLDLNLGESHRFSIGREF
ncbi:MAG: PorV/PorQ family protein [Candidatus Eisenbacteria bacterium]